MADRMLVYTAPTCDWRVRGRLLERYGGEARPCVLGPPEAMSGAAFRMYASARVAAGSRW